MSNGCSIIGVKLSVGRSLTINEYKNLKDEADTSLNDKEIEIKETIRSPYKIMFDKVNMDLVFVSSIMNKIENTKLTAILNKTLVGGIPTINIVISCRDYEMLLIPVGETKMATTKIKFKGNKEVYVKDTPIHVIFSFIELFDKYKVKGKIRTKYAGKLRTELEKWINLASKSTESNWFESIGKEIEK